MAGVAHRGVPLNARSHGEGFLAFLESRTLERGLWILDEPESALSFRSSLRLVALLHRFTARDWAELDLVQDWKAFFDDPRRLLHHLLDD